VSNVKVGCMTQKVIYTATMHDHQTSISLILDFLFFLSVPTRSTFQPTRSTFPPRPLQSTPSLNLECIYTSAGKKAMHEPNHLSLLSKRKKSVGAGKSKSATNYEIGRE
jgi:hypothetical protein